MRLNGFSRYLCQFLALLLFSFPATGGLLQNARPAGQDLRQSATPEGEREGPARQAQELLALSGRQNQENHTLALQTAQQALALWQTLNDDVGIARAYSQIGRCYFARSDLPEAIQNYEKALQLWRVLNKPRDEAQVLIMLGYIEDRKGEWANSISLLTQAQNLIDEKTQPLEMGQIASGLADVFNESGLPENGLIQLQRALDYYRQTPSLSDDNRTIWALGSTYYLLGNYPEALKHLQQALAGVAPDSLDAALCHAYLGRVYRSTGEPSLALQHLQPALDIYTRAVNPQEAAQVRALMGQVYQQQGKIARAREYYQAALESFRALSDRVNESATLYASGQLEMKQNNLRLAEDYLRQSLDVTEDMRRVPTSRDLTAAFSASVHERYDTYIECLMRRQRAEPAQDLSVRAFETSEMARARSLAELLRETETNVMPGLDPHLAQQEESLRQALRVKEDSKVALLGSAYKKEELDSLETDLGRLKTEYKQVAETIQQRYPAYEQLTRPTTWNLRQIQEQVVTDDQTVLLEYSLGAEQSYAWAITRNGFTTYALPAQSRITEAAQKVYELLASAGGEAQENALTRAAQELSQMVLSPVASELNKSRLIVVADGALNYVPFQFLPAPSDSREPLVANYEVINVPSASILGQLRLETARRQKPAKVLAAFGDPVFESNYAQSKDSGPSEVASLQPLGNDRWRHALRDIEPTGDSFDRSTIHPLLFAKREIANLRDVAGPDTLVVTGFDATRERLASADLTKYSILHFATHGILDPKRPENSGLFLSMVNRDGQPQNGFIGLQDIYSLRAPVDLVVLSACRTGLGKDVRGEGLIGLTRGFMYAGASSVIASLWKVDDEATAELMKHFYSNMLQHGMTPAAALRQAQNTIRQQPHWRSPYFWAAFTLQGDYTRVIHVPQATATKRYLNIVVMVAVLVLLAGAGWWWFRRRRMARTS
jgi:CHAT domain-containing protein